MTSTDLTLRTYPLEVGGVGTVEPSVAERGAGSPYLLLHGGGGPQTVTGFAELLAATGGARAIVPTHPGFDGTPRPEGLTSIRELAALYVALLDELDVADVTVLGNSVGGWIAAEMALLGSPRVGRVVLLDAVGIEVEGHPVADFFSLTLDEMSELSFHDPEKFRIDPTQLPPAARAALPGNFASLATYAGEAGDPTLSARLARIAVPVLVLWGEDDGVADVGYGRAYAAAIPAATFRLLPQAGHLPQVETPEPVLDALAAFAAPGGTRATAS